MRTCCRFRVHSIGQGRRVCLSQLGEQGFCLLQVWRIEALDKRVVD